MSRFTLCSAWFRCIGSILSLLGFSFGTMGGTVVITQGIYASALLLPLMPPDLILGAAFYPLEEGGTNLCNVVLHPIVWNLGPPSSGTSLCPKCVRGPSCRGPYYQRAQQPHSRRPSPLVLGSPCILHHDSRTCTAMHRRTAGPHALGCPIPYDCHG